MAARVAAASAREAVRVAANPELVAAGRERIPPAWPECSATAQSSWTGWSLGEFQPPTFLPGEGIPATPLREVSPAEVRVDGDILVEQRGWVRMPQDAAHPNARFHEDPAFTKFSVSDPTIFETNVTEHVPIFYFHEDQRRVATAAGAPFRLLEGPSPFGGFGSGPASWPAMHIDPDRSWFRAVAAIEDTAAQTAQLEDYGIPLRPNAVEGGRGGIRYGFEELHPEFRRCEWKDVDGRPQMRTPSLPDEDTDMNMHAFYVACMKAGLSDLEVVSKIRLYGVRSDSTAATGVDVLQRLDTEFVSLSRG